jgi:hypothetical protein
LIISIIQLLDLDLKTPDHTTLEVASLVEQIDAPILEALGDGGYDHTATYAAIDKRHRQLNSSKTNLGLTFKF